jgi:RNA polymerase sigma-70 factor, ECF subfamily
MDDGLHSRAGDDGRVREVELLVRLASQGDAEAFGKLYDIHLDAVYRYLYYKVRNGAEAEDLTSQVFLKAWEAMPRYQVREAPFVHWLIRLARNAVIDRYRTARSHEGLSEALQSRDPDPQGEYLREERARELVEAIRRLPEEYQTVIALRFMQDMTYQELAGLTGKSPGALRVIQHRALGALRRLLDREG